MARDWPRLPAFDTPDIDAPAGWSVRQIESIFDQLPIGKRYDQKSTHPSGNVPVIDQSSSSVIGWHNDAPGIRASSEQPVVTFANHTCEMRMMRRPFSVIQNVFPLIGKPDICLTEFLYYTTKGRIHLEEYKGHFPDFRRKWVPVPPLVEQRAIARILGALDDKIELNRQMNETLEALARALFQSWFVDFDPVRAKMRGEQPVGMDAATAALFPSQLVPTEHGEVPRGWTHAPLTHAFAIRDGSIFRKEDRTTKSNIAVFGANGEIGYSLKANCLEPCVILGKIGSCGSLHRSWSNCWVTNNAFFVTQTALTSLEFTWQTLRNIDFGQFIGGSANPYMPIRNFGHQLIILPSTDLVAAFESVASRFAKLTHENLLQSANLAATRDLLLPRLLSGELRVVP